MSNLNNTKLRVQNVQDEEQATHSSQTEIDKKSSGLGLLGKVSTLAWDLVIPIVGGVLIGSFIDKRTGSDFTWSLSLLVLGVLIAFTNLYNLYIEHGGQHLEGDTGKMADKVTHDEKE